MSGGPDPQAPVPRLIGPVFVAVLALGLICVLGGAAVWALAPRHAPAVRAAPPHPPPAPLGGRTRSR